MKKPENKTNLVIILNLGYEMPDCFLIEELEEPYFRFEKIL